MPAWLSNGEHVLTAAEVASAGGHGAIYALRAALKQAYAHVDDFELIDYRVRILDQGHGTDAIVRTLIDTTDGERTWTTVGVGDSVVEASWEALHEAYRWGLLSRVPDAVEPPALVEASA